MRSLFRDLIPDRRNPHSGRKLRAVVRLQIALQNAEWLGAGAPAQTSLRLERGMTPLAIVGARIDYHI